jgi:hypothetical protein
VLKVRVGFDAAGNRLVDIEAAGTRVKEDLNIPAILEGADNIPLTPENAVIYYTRMLIEEVSVALQQQYSSSMYALKLRFPVKSV